MICHIIEIWGHQEKSASSIADAHVITALYHAMRIPWQDQQLRCDQNLRLRLVVHFGITIIDPWLLMRIETEGIKLIETWGVGPSPSRPRSFLKVERKFYTKMSKHTFFFLERKWSNIRWEIASPRLKFNLSAIDDAIE